MRVLITGKNSSIGNHLKNHLEKQGGYDVAMLSMRDDGWKAADLSAYDAIVHAAAIAHQKEEAGEMDQYMAVNATMTHDLAQRAKEEGVKNFIFLSTMAVYGVEGSVKNPIVIGKETPVNPVSLYGKSKLEAEKLIAPLQAEGFSVASIRPPLVYGKGCKGNYARFEQLGRKLPGVPKVENQRSMLYVGNLCEFIRLLIDTPQSGVFFPQNKEYVATSDMLSQIARQGGKSGKLSGFLGKLMLGLFSGNALVNKVFGSLVYTMDLSDTFDFRYCIYDFAESFSE